jgi:hypothetical protein
MGYKCIWWTPINIVGSCWVNVWFCPIWHRFWPMRTWDPFEGYWMSASFLDFGLRKICVRMFQGYPTVLDKNLKKGCWQHFHLVRRKSTIFKGHWFPRRDPPRLNPIPLFPHSLAHSGTTKKHNCWNPSWSIPISASTFIVFRHPFIHCIGLREQNSRTPLHFMVKTMARPLQIPTFHQTNDSSCLGLVPTFQAVEGEGIDKTTGPTPGDRPAWWCILVGYIHLIAFLVVLHGYIG